MVVWTGKKRKTPEKQLSFSSWMACDNTQVLVDLLLIGIILVCSGPIGSDCPADGALSTIQKILTKPDEKASFSVD
jgi:hypothetical protein